MRTFLLPFVVVACSSSDDAAGGALSGTLYFDEGADLTIHEVDLATGAHNQLGKGK